MKRVFKFKKGQTWDELDEYEEIFSMIQKAIVDEIGYPMKVKDNLRVTVVIERLSK